MELRKIIQTIIFRYSPSHSIKYRMGKTGVYFCKSKICSSKQKPCFQSNQKMKVWCSNLTIIVTKSLTFVKIFKENVKFNQSSDLDQSSQRLLHHYIQSYEKSISHLISNLIKVGQLSCSNRDWILTAINKVGDKSLS